ncbi:MAG TPA: hypothetical protein VJV77_16215 [Casimicrobiaceae bacterium]|nr:hypothetical protein [Casimicrobiaceae bacterium]
MAAALHRIVGDAIDASTRQEAERLDAAARGMIAQWLEARSDDLAAAFETAPSVHVARHLHRLLADVEAGDRRTARDLRATLFALPVIVVAGMETRAGDVTLPAVLADPGAFEATLRDANAFAGARTFAFSPALAGASAIDVRALPGLLVRGVLGEAHGDSPRSFGDVHDGSLPPPLDVAPSPIRVTGAMESVHLRFLVGAVLTARGSDPLAESSLPRWGTAVANALSRDLRAPGVTLLALPRPLARLVPALAQGRAAQREVAAQIFASNALRKLRASVGEPVAVISAHRADDAPGGGELRLSLSSPFAPRDAEGFRCQIYPYESVRDVATMLLDLLRDCRVADVRVRSGVHPDVDPRTGVRLLFKEAEAASQPLH